MNFSLLSIFLVLNTSSLLGHPLRSDSLNARNSPKFLFSQIQWRESKPDTQVFELAVEGYKALQDSLNVFKRPLLTIIDFSKPSNVHRLWVIDLESNQVLFNTLVAHGRNSGEIIPTQFSNKHNSFQSSLGFYVTGYQYNGKHGRSLTLKGLERGINDQAERRAIVVHGAEYVSETHIQSHGRLGRSQGCPAVSMKIHEPLIKAIHDQTCLFIYAPDKEYLHETRLINAKRKSNTTFPSRQL